MHEFHGWFALADDTEDVDDGRVSEAVDRLQPLLEPLKVDSSTSVLCRPLNGWQWLSIDGLTNHVRHADTLAAILDFLCVQLPGSWGLLYEQDDEAADEADRGAYSVRVLARGSVSRQADPFLSPTIPTISD